jgi:hypothetical protein
MKGVRGKKALAVFPILYIQEQTLCIVSSWRRVQCSYQIMRKAAGKQKTEQSEPGGIDGSPVRDANL